MFKALRLASALGAVLFALVGLSACGGGGGGGGIPGNAVVQVGGISITNATFKHWMKVATFTASTGALAYRPAAPEPPNYTACIAHLRAVGLLVRRPGGSAAGKPLPPTATLKQDCEYTYNSLLPEVLGSLIGSAWVLEEANSLGLKVSDEEVKKEFEKVKTARFHLESELESFLASSGETVSDLLLHVKVSMLSKKIRQMAEDQAGVKPTQAEIQKYYNEHLSLYATPATRSVEIILTKTEAAAKSAKREVESGKSFASVAERVSIDPTSKANGGLLTKVVKGQKATVLDTAIFSAGENVLSGPLKSPLGYYIYKVLTSRPGGEQSLAQVQASIERSLISSRRQAAVSKFVKAFEAKWTAKTDCRSGYVVADCKQYKG